MELWADSARATCDARRRTKPGPRDTRPHAPYGTGRPRSPVGRPHDRPAAWAGDARNRRPRHVPGAVAGPVRHEPTPAAGRSRGRCAGGSTAGRGPFTVVDGRPPEPPDHTTGRDDAAWGRGAPRARAWGASFTRFPRGTRCPRRLRRHAAGRPREAGGLPHGPARVAGTGHRPGDSRHDAGRPAVRRVPLPRPPVAVPPGRAGAGPGWGTTARPPTAGGRSGGSGRRGARNPCGPPPCRNRTAVERTVGHRVSSGGGGGGGGGGRAALPSWVRRTRRVRAWVWAKLLEHFHIGRSGRARGTGFQPVGVYARRPEYGPTGYKPVPRVGRYVSPETALNNAARIRIRSCAA